MQSGVVAAMTAHLASPDRGLRHRRGQADHRRLHQLLRQDGGAEPVHWRLGMTRPARTAPAKPRLLPTGGRAMSLNAKLDIFIKSVLPFCALLGFYERPA